MAQRVETYQIPFENGGFNANPNIDLIPPVSIVKDSRNYNLHNGGREKRGGTDLVLTLPDDSQVMGAHDFTLESLVQYIITANKAGKVYKDATTTIKTGMSTTNRFWFMTLRNQLYICDAATRPQVWNGTAASSSDITSIPSDWAGTAFPSMMFTHSNGAAFRNIALGVPGFKDTIYCSSSNDGQDFSDANVVKVVIPTNDAYGILAGAEFGQRALLFGKRKAYILNDADPVVANWGYVPVQWEGGVANPWLLIKTPNDLIAMMDDGEIYSVLAAQQYGDYQAASISRPSFIHTWIKQFVDLTRIAEFHASYDPNLRAIKFFMALKDHTPVDTCLLYFVDKQPSTAWAFHDNALSNSGYRASCSTLIKLGEGNYKTYTGGYHGEVWALESLTASDNGSGYVFIVKSPPMSFEQPRLKKLYLAGRMTLVSGGNSEIVVRWWVDGALQEARLVTTVPLAGIYGGSYYNSCHFGGDELIDPNFDLGQVGTRLELAFENANTGEKLFMSACYIDFKWIGKTPEKSVA